MDEHFGFIVAAFAVTALILAGTIAAVLLDHRAQKRAVARLSGVTEHRSIGPDKDAIA